jgi:hypothetical protein
MDYNVSGFTRINVKFAMEVEITQGEKYSVSISGSDTLIDNIDVALEGDRLVIGYHLNVVSFFAAPFSRAHARITMPALRELNITGAAKGTIRGFSSPESLAVYVSGASRLELQEMSLGSLKWELSGAAHITGQARVTGDMEIRINGASNVMLKGSAQDVFVDSAGASHIDLQEFIVRNARVRLTGASRCYVNMNGKLDVDLAGASTLEYSGAVTMGEARVTGASNLRKR